jgi:hypothetical protein
MQADISDVALDATPGAAKDAAEPSQILSNRFV